MLVLLCMLSCAVFHSLLVFGFLSSLVSGTSPVVTVPWPLSTETNSAVASLHSAPSYYFFPFHTANGQPSKSRYHRVVNSTLNSFPSTHSEISLPTDSLHRFKKPFDKLHHLSQQSINDLLADLMSKPLGLSNSTLISLEHLIADKVKLSRKLNVLVTTFSNLNHNYSNTADSHNNLEEIPAKQTAEEDNDVHHDSLNFKAFLKPYHSHPFHKGKLSKKKKSTSMSLSTLVGRCYEPYGCFRITEPYRTIYRPINLIPEPPSAVRVKFFLHTRSNPSLAEQLEYSEKSKYLVSKHFEPDASLKIIVHGYLESSEESWVNELSAALLNKENMNVVCVDWMMGAMPPYTQAVANTRLVGAIIGHFITTIQETYPDQYPASKIHIIGHSLGAHIAGYTGQLISNLGHITGLDPAEPYFQYTDPIVRLDPSDALFVDVVHTDVASIISGGFGMNQTCGHVDFYPNGGVNQPGCKETPIKNVLDSISKERTVFDGIRRFIGCNHLRSFLLYIEAINSECPFMAFPCASYEEFTSGQCTSKLIDGHHYQHCFDKPDSFRTVTSNKTFCPIRMGLNSERDFKRHLSPDNTTNSSTLPKELVYFLQTGDKVPFCHYHYNVKLVLHFVPYRYARSYHSQQFYLENFFPNGRIYLNVVGSRRRTMTETLLSQEDFADSDQTEPVGKGLFKEYDMLVSSSDLGTILRIEIEWRHSLPSQRSLIIPKQARSLRRWLPQLSVLDSSAQSILPNVLNELHRSLNVSQLSTNSPLKKWPNQLTEIISSKNIELYPETGQHENVGQKLVLVPYLESVIVNKLETSRTQIFCVKEPNIRRMFQTRGQPKTAILLASRAVDTTTLSTGKEDPTHSQLNRWLINLCDEPNVNKPT